MRTDSGCVPVGDLDLASVDEWEVFVGWMV